MKLLKPFLALAVVIVLGIAVYMTVYRAENENDSKKRAEGRLVQFDPGALKKFTLSRPDSSITFEYGENKVWHITAPVKAEAARQSIDKLFTLLTSIEILYDVDDKPKDLAPYGLSAPSYYLALEFQKGKPDTLFLGNGTPDKTMVYVRFASSRKVLAVSNTLTQVFQKPVLFYRSRTLLNIRAGDVQAVEIFRGKNDSDRISMLFDGVAWMMQAPWSASGNSASMEELLKNLDETNKQSFEAESVTPGDLGKYGLDNPTYVINVSLKNGMQDKTLLIGNRLPQKKGVTLWYAKQFDSDLVFTVKDNFVMMLRRPPIWFMDQQPVRFDRTAVNRIVLTSGREEIVFTRDTTGKWSAISPVDKNIEEGIINRLYSISRFLLVNDVLAYNPTPKDVAKAGLNHPRFTLTLYSPSQVLAKIEYGKSYSRSTTQLYLRTNLSPAIYATGAPVEACMNDVLKAVYGK